MSASDAAETLALVAAHDNNVRAAARAAKISRSTLQSRYQEALIISGVPPPKPPPPVEPMVREPLASFEEAWAQWSRTIGMMRDRYKGPPDRSGAIKKARGDRPERIKILVIPDVHAPFHNVEQFATMIAREKDIDKAICIGDLSDSYSLSTFTHYRSVGFSEEWASVTAALQAMSEAFPSVELVIGNHDGRLEKRLRERLTTDMVEAVKFMTGGLLCPITALAKQFPNVTVAKHIVPGGESVDWFTTCGDAWLGHPERYSVIPGAALRKVEEWLSDHETDLGLRRYRLICLGHTHTYSQFLWRSGQMLIEVGCLAQMQGYMLKPKIGGRPQRAGYVTFEQVNGVTDLNSVKFHYLGEEAAA